MTHDRLLLRVVVSELGGAEHSDLHRRDPSAFAPYPHVSDKPITVAVGGIRGHTPPGARVDGRDAYLRAVFREMAERDVGWEIMQQLLVADGPRHDVNVKADRTTVRARHIGEAMVAEEAGRVGTPPRLREPHREVHHADQA